MYCNIYIRRVNTYFNILYSNILHILFTPIYFSVTLQYCIYTTVPCILIAFMNDEIRDTLHSACTVARLKLSIIRFLQYDFLDTLHIVTVSV